MYFPLLNIELALDIAIFLVPTCSEVCCVFSLDITVESDFIGDIQSLGVPDNGSEGGQANFFSEPTLIT